MIASVLEDAVLRFLPSSAEGDEQRNGVHAGSELALRVKHRPVLDREA
jgi:hypothetical protein